MARIIHEASPAAADLGFLTGVLGPRPLRRSVQLRLGFSALWVLVIRTACAASLRTFVNDPGQDGVSPRVLIDDLAHKFFERNVVFPAELLAGTGSVTDRDIAPGRSDEFGIDLDVVVVAQAGPEPLAAATSWAGGEYRSIRVILVSRGGGMGRNDGSFDQYQFGTGAGRQAIEKSAAGRDGPVAGPPIDRVDSHTEEVRPEHASCDQRVSCSKPDRFYPKLFTNIKDLIPD